MDCKYGKSPAFGGRCWSSRHRNRSAKAVRILTAKVPGTGAAHAETRDGDLFPIDVVAAEDSVEERVHGALVLGSSPLASGRIRRDDDRAQFLQRRTHQDIEHAAARTVRLSSKMQCEDERNGVALRVVRRNRNGVPDPQFAFFAVKQHCLVVYSRRKDRHSLTGSCLAGSISNGDNSNPSDHENDYVTSLASTPHVQRRISAALSEIN